MIGVPIIDPKTPPFDTVNVPPAISSSAMLSARALRQVSHRFLKAHQRERLGVANHRHNEASRRRDSNRNVDVVAVHDLQDRECMRHRKGVTACC